MNPIRLYWYRARTATGINFGDDLSPLLVKWVSGREVVHAPSHLCDLASAGSILHHVGRGLGKPSLRLKRLLDLNLAPVHVWGSGAFGAQRLPTRRRIRVHAVRGPMTRSALGLSDRVPLGDPGLLVGELGLRRVARRRWGIIPHVDDAAHPAVRELANSLPNAAVIDLTEPDVMETASRIAACDFVVSSSLHGLIVADALGIPNVWVSFSGSLFGGDWKFHDYLSSVGHAAEAVMPLHGRDHLPTASELEGMARRADGAQLDKMKAALVAAFEAINL